MKYMNITQGIEVGTHVYSNAIDNAGIDKGIDGLFAPFDGVIKKKWATGNVVWLESLEKVEFADGTVDYATFMTVHDNDISNITVGQQFKQGQEYYQEGTAGNASGNHVHMEIAKGKFTGTGWYENPAKYWTLYNSVAPWLAFFLDGTIILNSYGYDWELLDMKMTRDLIYWHYWCIGGYEPSEQEIKNYLDKDYYFVTEDMKKFFANNGLGYYTYRATTDAQITGLNTQVDELTTALAQKPTEVVVEKVVIKEVEKIVVKGDEDRTFGDLLSAAFSKIFSRK